MMKMNFAKATVLLCLAVILTIKCYGQKQQNTLLSPDGNVKITLSVNNNQLFYQVDYYQKPVITLSALGLSVNNQNTNATGNLSLVKTAAVNTTFPWRGVHNVAVNNYKSAIYTVSGDMSFTFEVRAFNSGIAFRYQLKKTGDNTVTADNTVFKIVPGSTVWSQGDVGAYEGKYIEQKIEDVKNGQLVGPPLTIKLPENQGYAAITEGGVTNFAGMSLIAQGDNTFQAKLDGPAKLTGEIQSPWRIIEVGRDLNTLVNCDIIADVSPAVDKKLFPQGFATSWVKPGKSVWSWLADNGGVTFENMKRYSSWAGQLGIPYNLVDEGWSRWNDNGKDKWTLMKELVDYSKPLGVKIWVWKAYPDRNKVIGLKDRAARIDFFQHCVKAGVVGLKIDFFDTEAQQVLEFYQEALKDAAKMHLMLVFHGADKPTGQSRTWPNEMSREGIRGLENETSWPKHDVTLPFTRYLAGHADFTPMSLRQDLIKNTTLAHQVATLVVYTSPFMCLAVNPEALLASPVKSMVTTMPETWDETIVLPQSAIGQLAVFARRKGAAWYVGVLNGENAQNLKLNLPFLKSGKYETTLLEDDAQSQEKVFINTKSYNKNSIIDINLKSGGGFVAKFVKRPN